jgi:UPF0755 protein
LNRTCRTIALLLAFLFFIALICGGLVFVLAGDDLIDAARTAYIQLSIAGREDDLNRAAGADTTPVRFTVNSGDTAAVIGQNLFAAGLIVDGDLFSDYVRAESLDVELEAGTYFLNTTQTIPQIAEALTDSRNSQIVFTIIEGWRIEQIAEAIDANPLFGFSGGDFLAAAGRGAQVSPSFAQRVDLPEGASLEGFLFPDTYSLPPDIMPEALRDLLVESFLLETEALAQDAEAQSLSLYEVAILASIVQREARQVDEAPLIAGVYLNRLAIGMKLDADPTVQYALNGSRGEWWPRITVDDYQGVQSDYNTYLPQNVGLPPGPIANPGLAALRAVVYPQASEYFYFRADCRDDGYHDFSEDFETHAARC